MERKLQEITKENFKGVIPGTKKIHPEIISFMNEIRKQLHIMTGKHGEFALSPPPSGVLHGSTYRVFMVKENLPTFYINVHSVPSGINVYKKYKNEGYDVFAAAGEFTRPHTYRVALGDGYATRNQSFQFEMKIPSKIWNKAFNDACHVYEHQKLINKILKTV